MAEIGQGLVLMGVGMSIVYLFLTTLIFVTKCACTWIGKFDSILPQDAPKKAAPKAVASNTDADIALAIAVALG
jgi:sodium pump decarboxylase gamma subunit